MRVFLSWSGPASRLVAEALRDWLPNVIQAIEPWLSTDDIPLGGRWQSEIAARLETSAAGIICLTRENVSATWLNYEAGALSRTNALVCPYLLDLQPAEVTGPLGQFQCAKGDRHDTLSLIETLNAKAADRGAPERVLLRSFDLHWPSLEARLDDIRRTLPQKAGVMVARGDLAVEVEIARSADEKLDEILELLRGIVDARGTLQPVGKASPTKTTIQKKPKVFIGSSTEGLRVAEVIQLGLELVADCTLWTQAFPPGQTVIESILDATLQHDFAVLVLTPDDLTLKRGAPAAGPRDNVLFELGLFTGALGRARTFMVVPREQGVKFPSDLSGVTAVTYSARDAGNLEAALGPVCTRIKQAMGVA